MTRLALYNKWKEIIKTKIIRMSYNKYFALNNVKVGLRLP